MGGITVFTQLAARAIAGTGGTKSRDQLDLGHAASEAIQERLEIAADIFLS
jgi:hypothetical protein